MDPDTGESIVLEEEIDENYEPTEEEIFEYAAFLGMDVEKDKDLLYIAKEGLKAPLPEPWKPCQTREKEIYYFNFETGESTWDHPCDEHYRKMYEKEKQKQSERKPQPQKMPSSGATNENKQLANLGASSSKKQAKMPMPLLKLDELSKSGNIAKKDDPLIKAANDKKSKQYREQREKEVHQEIQAFQAKLEKKKKELDVQHQKKIKDLDLEYDMKRTEMKEKVRKENRPIDKHEISAEKNKQEVELRNEAEKTLAHRIKLLQEELSLKLEDSKEKFNHAKTQKQKEITEQIASSYAEEMQSLENDMFKLKLQQAASNTEDLEAFEHNTKKSFANEQEMKFHFDKENLLRLFRQKTAELKDIALQRQREEISRLHKKFESENLKQEKIEELDPEYEKELARDLKAKIEDYKHQINNKTEIMKFEVQEKLREYEGERMRQFTENLKEELSFLHKDFQQYKEMLETDFSKEKLRLQKKSDDEISALRQITLEQIQEKKKTFDEEQLDKILNLKFKVNRIKEFDEQEALDVKDKLTQMENGISKSQRALKFKHDEYSKEQLVSEGLKKEIQFVENRYKTELGVLRKVLGVTGDLDSEIETLARVIRENDAKIAELKSQKLNRNEEPPELHGFNIDKLQFEVTNIKEFLKENRPSADRGYGYSGSKKSAGVSFLNHEEESDRMYPNRLNDRPF